MGLTSTRWGGLQFYSSIFTVHGNNDPTTILEEYGFRQAQVLNRGLGMAMFLTMHGPVRLTLLTALVAVIVLSKGLLNSCFSEHKCCLGGE